MDWDKIDGIEHLSWAEPSFIQVLLSRFALRKTTAECVLTVEFAETEKAITQRITRERIQDAIPDFANKAAKYEAVFDKALLERSIGNVIHEDTDFRFRYASGGTLPILLMDGQEFYCLFSRDVLPLGWNIANGGCDSFAELIDPTITIGRELSEELIIIALFGNRDYVYRSAEGRAIERPEFEIAREQWNSFFGRMDFRSLKRFEVDVDWIDGPDRLCATLVSADGFPLLTNPRTRCFVNITASDFSIEVDKIARIPVEGNALLLDGEISNHKILGRPIGLFEVNKTNDKLLSGETEFYPDRLYFFGNPQPEDKDALLNVVFKQHLPRLIKAGIRNEKHLPWLQEQNTRIFNMCPITARMIRRYIGFKDDVLRAQPTTFTLFISHSSKDSAFVDKLCLSLGKAGITHFRSPDSMKPGDDVLETLFRAIGESNKLLVVVSENSLDSWWVRNEVNEAVRLEAERKRAILVPIRIDEYLFRSTRAWARLIGSRQVLDFSNWEDCCLYDKALQLLHDALRT
ncbi:MAG TPA: toll/interleukin-1 receptor domain-containing protein [Candidatus Hydrogenedentes bacterium]|nr:toll/interleukin-1 receptor domain-containing protein [Candidatus Hydrogenedentota bacterium]HIJ74399.1 toll/interleukin-1 receptor domain-containing protein [Candidatus Hydrogenedentota bacterium]